MNILYYISGYDGCGYYRVQLPAKYLNKIPNVFAKISSKYNNSEIDWADIIILQKQVNQKALTYVEYAKGRGKKIICECDDNYFSIPPWNPAYAFYKDLKKDLINFYNISDAMTVTTEHLKNSLLGYNPFIFEIPNCMDIPLLDSYNKLSKEELNKHTNYLNKDQEEIPYSLVQETIKDKIVIGHGGSPTHLRDLDQATEALKQICLENKNVILMFLACTTDTIMNTIPKEQLILIKPVPIFKYHQTLASLPWDIGICPIEDNSFNRSKSNLKFLEFSSNGIPCVCSNVENYTKTVKHGETGLLAKNTKESWYENLSTLIKNEELRKAISKNAAIFVRNNFDITDKVNIWFELYNKVLGRKDE